MDGNKKKSNQPIRDTPTGYLFVAPMKNMREFLPASGTLKAQVNKINFFQFAVVDGVPVRGTVLTGADTGQDFKVDRTYSVKLYFLCVRRNGWPM